MAYSNADAPTRFPPEQNLVFAKPHEESQSFEEFLNFIIAQEIDPNFSTDAEVRYAQTRKFIKQLTSQQSLWPKLTTVSKKMIILGKNISVYSKMPKRISRLQE